MQKSSYVKSVTHINANLKRLAAECLKLKLKMAKISISGKSTGEIQTLETIQSKNLAVKVLLGKSVGM